MDLIRVTWPRPVFRRHENLFCLNQRGIGGVYSAGPGELKYVPVGNSSQTRHQLETVAKKFEEPSPPETERKELVNHPPTDSVLESAAELKRQRDLEDELEEAKSKKRRRVTIETLLSE